MDGDVPWAWPRHFRTKQYPQKLNKTVFGKKIYIYAIKHYIFGTDNLPFYV